MEHHVNYYDYHHRDYDNHNDYNLIDLTIISFMIIMNHKDNDYHVDHTLFLLL